LPDNLDLLGEPVFVFDTEGRIIGYNESASEDLGYTDGEMDSMSAKDLLNSGDLGRFRGAIRKAPTEDSTVRVTLFKKDGSRFPVEIHLSPLPDEYPGEVIGVGRKQEKSHRKDGTAVSRERAISRVYDTISDTELSLDDKVHSLLGIVRETVGADFATLSRIDGDEYTVKALDSREGLKIHGLDTEPIEEGDTVPLSVTNCEVVVNSMETLVYEDVSDDPSLAARPVNAEMGISCYLGTPVRVGDEVYGTFCLYDTEPREEEFSEWEVTFVELLGNWVGHEVENKRLLETIRAEERQRYEKLVEQSRDGVVVVQNGEYVFANDQFLEMTGLEEKEVLGMSFEKVFTPEYRGTVTERYEKRVVGKTPPNQYEAEIETSDNKTLTTEIAASRIEHEGEPATMATLRDVTQRKHRERKLREQKAFTESIFAALPDVFYAFEKDGSLLRWNDQLEETTGYPGSEIQEMYVTDFVPTGEIEKIASNFQAIIEDRRSVTVESEFETKEGDRVPFEFTGAPLEDADGTLRGVTGIGRDISNRKERERRFEGVFNNTYQFTGLMETDGTLLEVNQTAANFAGLSRETLVGEKLWDTYWFQKSEQARRTARESVEKARDGEFFREQLRVQGDERTAVVDFSVRPVTNEKGEVELLVPEGRDVTPLTEREQQLQVTNRFLRHNIRNKLTTIRGNACLIPGADKDRIESASDLIIEAAEELADNAEKAREVHELVQRDTEPKEVSLVGHLQQAIESLRAENPEVELTMESTDGVVVKSLPSLGKAFVELMSVVLTETETDRLVITAGTEDEETAVAVVEVPGGRLPEAEREVLTGEIEVNQLRHAQGLGVWYVYWHVRYSGGEIEVTDDGGEIRVYLPRN